MPANIIMLVDDKKELISQVESGLAQQGYQIVLAESGLEALSIARSQKIDLIILDLDIRAPNMDRYDLIQQLRSPQKTPMILVTARANDTEKIAALEAGADDFLIEPLRLRELIARVGVILRRRK